VSGAARFAAVDWGTTRMRVWLIDVAGEALAERRSDEGLLSAREGNRFGAILEAHLAAMGAPAGLPVFSCGMVGARQGWVEAPYVAAPAALDAVLSQAVPVPNHPARPVRIVPGIAQREGGAPDVMRGEETQLAGLRAMLGGDSHLVCMPGTHSKWVSVRDGRVERFATYLTGELFSLLSRQSILAHSLGDAPPDADGGSPSFRDAVRQAGAADWAGLLFSIRAGGLLDGASPADAASRLSGLLIGGEIAAAARRFGGDGVLLVASGAMADLYAAALEAAGLGVRLADADEAVRTGLIETARLNLDAETEPGP
jgi:2-dehydro-3-deoxygalactonokinase